jgi:single-strand DNA-binding protein
MILGLPNFKSWVNLDLETWKTTLRKFETFAKFKGSQSIFARKIFNISTIKSSFMSNTSFEIVGKLYRKFPAESKSQSFQVREFVIEIMDGNYPQLAKFQLTQERCQSLDAYNEGETVKVFFDLRGREWQGKFFTTLNCWRLSRPEEGAVGSSATIPVQQVATQSAPPPPPPPRASGGDDFPTLANAPVQLEERDDLPF